MQTSHIDNYISKLQKWLNDNIHFYAWELVNDLIEKKNITEDQYDNFYKNGTESRTVYQWYVVSKNAYSNFKEIGDPVIKYKEMYIWGRTCENQPIVMDYYNDIKKIKILLKSSITDY